MKELRARARVLTVGSEDVRCRVEQSEGLAALTQASDALEEAKARQKDVRERQGKKLPSKVHARADGCARYLRHPSSLC